MHSLTDTIDAYLNGTMPETERQVFEQTMAMDEALVRKVELYKLERQGIERLVQTDLKSKMQDWQQQFDLENGQNTEGEDEKKLIKSNYRLLALALVLGFIGIITIIIAFKFFNTTTIDPKPSKIDSIKANIPILIDTPKTIKENTSPIVQNPQAPIIKENQTIQPNDNQPIMQDIPVPSYLLLAQNSYDKPDFEDDVLKGSGISTDVLSNALKAWHKKDYDQVIALAETIERNNISYLRAQELLAHAYFLTKKYEKAEKTFAVIVENNKGGMGDNALWYQALTLLSMDKKDKAMTLFRTISQDVSHPFRDKAINILDTLGSNRTQK
jgi:hypothetical protein